MLAVAAVLAFGLAAGQPVFERMESRRARSASEVVFVVDVSRSMLASQGTQSETRLARARAIVRELRASVADVPAGLSGLTDRVLPFLFPTLDDVAFGPLNQGKSRAQARQIAMYLCRELTSLSLPKIGQLFGNRDHTTVMYANKKISELMKERRSIYNQVTELTSRIKQDTRYK